MAIQPGLFSGAVIELGGYGVMVIVGAIGLLTGTAAFAPRDQERN